MSKQEARLVLIIGSFMIDSVLAYFLPYSFDKTGIMLIPCFGLIMFTFINHHLKSSLDCFVYPVGVGLYYCVVYTNLLLIYVLIYALIGFIGRKYERISSFTFFESLLFCFIAFSIKEFILYAFMKFITVTNLSIMNFISLRYLPSLVLNLILFIIAYFVFRKYQEIAIKKGYEC